MKPPLARARPRALLAVALGVSGVRRQHRPAKPPATAGSVDVQYEGGRAGARGEAGYGPAVLDRPQRSDPGAAAAETGGAGAAEGRALLAQERPRGHRRSAQGAAARHLQPVGRRRAATTRAATRSASPTSWPPCSGAAPRPAAPTTSRARSTSSADRWTRARAARPRPRAARRCRRTPPCAWTCWPTSCCGRRSPRTRWPRCAIRCWPAIAARFDNPHELAMAHFANLLFGEKNPEGWVLTAEDVKQDHPRAPGDVLADVLPANRAILAVAGDVDVSPARDDRQGVRRLGARQRSRRAPAGRCPR